MTRSNGSLVLQEDELKRSSFSPLLIWLSGARRLRKAALHLALRLEGGSLYSATARGIMALRYGVTIGAYSYGGCFVPGMFPSGCGIGRYVSVAQGIRVFRRNHPMERLSMHPFFFNSELGLLTQDNVESQSLDVEHDAWIGERAIITPGCRRIGVGAVVGAGSVVTADVEDFAVVGGVPARRIRYRFSEPIRGRILASQWWEKPISELARHLGEMVKPINDECAFNHPALAIVESPSAIPSAGKMKVG